MKEKETTPETALNILQRMSAITDELQTVAKNLSVSAGKTSYKAVSERDIIDAVKPAEVKWGVYSYPASREVLESQMLVKESEYNGKVSKTTTLMTRIKTVYRFCNVDKPDEFIETTTFAEGMDTQDKGSGKAMTYADKYALMKAYKISTGDDPDQKASEPAEYKQASKPVQSVTDPDLQGAIIEAERSQTIATLQGVWNSYEQYQGAAAFKAAVSKRKKELA